MHALQELDRPQGRHYSTAQAAAVMARRSRPGNECARNEWPRSVTQPDAETLMAAVAATRDSQAFGALFGLFAPRIKAFMIRGGADPATAEELSQETMVQVWRRADSFDPAKASASTWIFTIARNKRIDRLRREGRPAPDPELYEAELPRPASPFETVDAAQTESVLRRGVEALSAEQLEVIEKAFYEDKSHAVIAEELGLPLGTVKSRIRLALGRLRTMMESEGMKTSGMEDPDR